MKLKQQKTPYNRLQKRHSESKGFTLVELIVSMALFIIVVFITTSAFLTLATLSEKASTTRIAMDNLNIAIEMMARSIRTGYTYHCDSDLAGSYSASDLKGNGFMDSDGTPSSSFGAKDCSGGLPYIAFASADGDLMFFRLYNTNAIRRARGIDNQTSNITAPDIFIDTFKVYVIGADNSSGAANQPRVNIVVQGTAGTDPRTQTKFNIYTSVTQRAPK